MCVCTLMHTNTYMHALPQTCIGHPWTLTKTSVSPYSHALSLSSWRNLDNSTSSESFLKITLTRLTSNHCNGSCFTSSAYATIKRAFVAAWAFSLPFTEVAELYKPEQKSGNKCYLMYLCLLFHLMSPLTFIHSFHRSRPLDQGELTFPQSSTFFHHSHTTYCTVLCSFWDM